MSKDIFKNFEGVLVSSLARTIDWIKYAEAKNAILVTLASAWLLASATLSANPTANVVPALVSALVHGVPLIFIAGAIAFASFFPDLRLKEHFKRRASPPSNLLFYDHVRTLTPENALNALEAAYMGSASEMPLSRRYYNDLAVQIVINSGIAARKFKMFAWALCFVAAAFVIFAWHIADYLI